MIVCIDGPSGAGKSTVAKAVAARLGFACLDTGAMYRAIAWRALRDGIAADDAAGCEAIARECRIAFTMTPGDPMPQGVSIDGDDVTAAIRTARIDAAVSPVSAHPGVREAMLEQQRRIAEAGDFVVEGRDVGTVVFPDAALKVFLTASDAERATRRVRQNEQRGIGSTDYDEVLAAIVARDAYDSSREVAPLRAAQDAVPIDSTELSIEAVVERICALARERGAA